MAANVPPPQMFLPCPGEPPLPFATWMRMFNNYLLVINATGNAWPEVRKRATLLHCLSAEGQRIFYSLPDTGDTFNTAVAALEKYFTPKVNAVVERYNFRKRIQAHHETISQYVAALCDLASKCGFEDKTDEMIRDQLIEHVTDSSIRERLLLETDLTLDKAVTVATQVELAVTQAKMISAPDSAAVQAVRPHQQVSRKTHRSHLCQIKPANATSASHNCFRCGSDKHLANFPQCPAAKATCKACHKVGHFARVCRSSKTGDVREVCLPKTTILYLRDSCHVTKKLLCKVNVSTPASIAKEIELVVDTGSAVSILPHSIYNKCFSDIPLLPPAVSLVTYTRKTIPVLGCLQATVTRGDSTASSNFYVVRTGTPLLGRDLMGALKVCIKGTAVLPPSSSAASPAA